jgi:large subunit ribosomal protein L4
MTNMASLTVYDQRGNAVGTYEVQASDFAPRINRQLLHDVVVMYRANLRQGSVRTKSRGEVAGAKKKMYRQKGTGNARAGSKRSGIRRGGGHIFAVRPRDHSYTMPRKAVQLATRMAIASKIRAEQVVVVDAIALDTPRTRDMAGILKALKCQDERLLLATDGYDEVVYKAARNIRDVTVSPATELNALALLSSRKVLITRKALDGLRARAQAAVVGRGRKGG